MNTPLLVDNMKIHDLQGTQPTVGSEKKASNPVSGAQFKSMLEAQLQAVSSPGAVSPASPVTATSQVPVALRVESLSVVEATINNLETFGTALQNLEVDSQSLEPFVETLEEETSSMLRLKEQLPADDPLSQLLDQVASVSYNEAAKYRRGDYH